MCSVVLAMLLDYIYVVMQVYSDLLAHNGSENCVSQLLSADSVSEIGVIF
jgi:hypothetical protein